MLICSKFIISTVKCYPIIKGKCGIAILVSSTELNIKLKIPRKCYKLKAARLQGTNKRRNEEQIMTNQTAYKKTSPKEQRRTATKEQP